MTTQSPPGLSPRLPDTTSFWNPPTCCSYRTTRATSAPSSLGLTHASLDRVTRVVYSTGSPQCYPPPRASLTPLRTARTRSRIRHPQDILRAPELFITDLSSVPSVNNKTPCATITSVSYPSPSAGLTKRRSQHCLPHIYVMFTAVGMHGRDAPRPASYLAKR